MFNSVSKGKQNRFQLNKRGSLQLINLDALIRTATSFAKKQSKIGSYNNNNNYNYSLIPIDVEN